MISVFSSAARVDRLPRPWPMIAGSATLHAAAAAAVVTLAGATASVVTPPTPVALRFVHVIPEVPAAPPVRLPPLPKPQLARAEAPVPAPEPPPMPEPIVARVESAPRVPEVVPEPAAERPAPRPAPAVSVGAFDTPSSARTTDAARAIEPAGFDVAASRTGDATRGAVLGDAGFGAVGGGTRRGAAGAVVSGGFDAGAGGTGKGGASAGAVRTADFDAPAAARPAPQQVRQAATEVPLEILSKPVPAYTDEARALRIEGEVLLDVEFTATGRIRVLRVVRSLGHGLDESAVRSVEHMRFTPAFRNGQPVDIRTTVNVVFRLA